MAATRPTRPAPTPGERIHPETIVVMDELGLDLDDREPKGLNV